MQACHAIQTGTPKIVPDSVSDSHPMKLVDATVLLRNSGPCSFKVPAFAAFTAMLLGDMQQTGEDVRQQLHRLTTADFGAMLHLRLRMRSQLGRCTSAMARTQTARAVRPPKPRALCTLLLGGALGLALARPTFCASWPMRKLCQEARRRPSLLRRCSP